MMAKGIEIEKRSFEIIASRMKKKTFQELELPLVMRVIHATGDFDFEDNLRFHPEAVKAGIRALKSGKNILVDVNMVAAGINRRLLERWGGKVICNIQKSEVRSQKSEVKTKAEIGIELGLKENNNIGIIAIGNAPTALLRTIDILANSELRTLNSELLVVGVPVGFVNAGESKEALAKKTYPFITSLGRKGGSPVAVAIVNGILRLMERVSVHS